MKFSKEMLRLYAVTDRNWVGEQTLAEQVEAAIRGGATIVQLREKSLSRDAFLAEAKKISFLCRRYQIPFLINDNVDIAVKMDADGVHVGQSDMEAGDVRAKLGPDKIIGVSCKTVAEALLAQQRGADYLGVGAVFPTDTKADASEVSFETLREICAAVDIPVVAIGGIKASNAMELKGSGIAGISVVSAIFAQPDIKQATAHLKAVTEQVVHG